jgi:AraC family transcriptional regulator
MGAWVQSREEDGVGVTEAALGGIGVVELRFPARYEQPSFGPEHGYLALVLDGDLRKSFPRRTLTLAAGAIATIPPEATHAASFGAAGARILIVRPPPGRERPYASLLDGVRVRRDPGLTALARRISGELSASDEAAPVAVEGLAFELVAAAVRTARGGIPSRRPAWLGPVVEQLHAEPAGSPLRLTELAATANVDPAHLGRVFRRHYGVSLGTYLRRLRLDRAAATLTGTDAPLARIAVEHGFADQSHFTRAFKHHTGVTPARYRRLARRA